MSLFTQTKMKIEVVKSESSGIDLFSYYADGCLCVPTYKVPRCYKCNRILSEIYVEIINRLKQNKLLSDDYKVRCCYCHPSLMIINIDECLRMDGGLND